MNNEPEILVKFRKAILECFMVPNDKLPKEFRNEKEGMVSLASLDQKSNDLDDKRNGLTEFKKIQLIKNENIEKMRRQVESKQKENAEFMDLHEELDWSDNNIDELSLYKNQMSFAKYCPLIELDD